MNKPQVVAMLGLLDRAGLTNYREGMAEAWLLVLESERPEDAMEATKRLIATRGDGNTWIVPADVLSEIALVRRERIRAVLDGSLPCPPPEIDPDNHGAYQAWRKTFMEALGDGQPLHHAETAAAHAAGIPPVHRALEEHRGAKRRELEAAPVQSDERASSSAREAIEAVLRRLAEPKKTPR